MDQRDSPRVTVCVVRRWSRAGTDRVEPRVTDCVGQGRFGGAGRCGLSGCGSGVGCRGADRGGGDEEQHGGADQSSGGGLRQGEPG